MPERKLDYDHIVSLHKLGLQRKEIAGIIGVSPSVIRKTLSRLGMQTYYAVERLDYEVVHDPSGLFDKGRCFTSVDINTSLKMATWPCMIEFRVISTGNVMMVVNGKRGQRLIKVDEYGDKGRIQD